VIIEVLGIDCAQTHALEGAVALAVADLDLRLEADVRRVSDPAAIIARRARRWPALVIDGRVVCRGRVPAVAEIRTLLDAARA
jgi:hypothetical protein